MSNQQPCSTITKNETQLVDADALGAMLSMSRQQVWRLHRQGRIPVLRLGRRTHRYDVMAVRAALAGNN
jgi:predicted DNA-binding transcriptional regulator AlpA